MRLLLTVCLLFCLHSGAADPPNTLTGEERRQGFELLFDGRSLEGWELMRPGAAEGQWVVEEGCLVPRGRPRELMTTRDYGDFELLFDWKIARAGNSGVLYRVVPKYGGPSSGPEFQLLDDENHPAYRFEDRRTGAAYGVYAPEGAAAKPAGQWNTARILVWGQRVEHWLNGVKLLAYEIDSPDWRKRVAASKFAQQPQYGRAVRGRIVLQDHASAVWFRNLKIRRKDSR